MVHVVFAKVVFGKVGDVGLLDMGDVARSQHADIHVGGMLVCIEYGQRKFNVHFDDSAMRDNEVGVTPATCLPSLFGGGV